MLQSKQFERSCASKQHDTNSCHLQMSDWTQYLKYLIFIRTETKKMKTKKQKRNWDRGKKFRNMRLYGDVTVIRNDNTKNCTLLPKQGVSVYLHWYILHNPSSPLTSVFFSPKAIRTTNKIKLVFWHHRHIYRYYKRVMYLCKKNQQDAHFFH
jgi:hypothetical protein